MGILHAVGSFFIPGLGQVVGGDVKLGFALFFTVILLNVFSQGLIATGFLITGLVLMLVSFAIFFAQVYLAWSAY